MTPDDPAYSNDLASRIMGIIISDHGYGDDGIVSLRRAHVFEALAILIARISDPEFELDSDAQRRMAAEIISDHLALQIEAIWKRDRQFEK